ncbi:MAG: histidinol-phosphate transaminase [Micrococcales bacterium]|nr:histidinol-phosphate transaminase [Micrococcales bacterium]MCL2667644.1 histidinol-phosphate transaminase [Micrococcales bacterium]
MSRVEIRPTVAALPGYGPVPVGPQAFKLSSNENPYPPLPSVVAALADAAVDVNRYPDIVATELSQALGETLGVAPEQVVPTAGSVSALFHAVNTFCDPGDEVVLPWRSFEAYPTAIALAGATAVPVPLADDGRLDMPGLAAAVTDRTRMVMVCSPNNPTGPAVHADELDALLDAVPDDVVVLYDEAYLEFVRDPQAVDGIDVLAEHSNVVLLRTFSKAYGLAGLRVGYAVARPRLATAVRKTVTPFEVSSLAQRAAVASLAATDELTRRVEGIVAERTRLVTGLRDQGWTIPDTQANFVWFPLGERTAAFADRCTSAGLLVRPFSSEGVRVTVGEPEANDMLLELTATI